MNLLGDFLVRACLAGIGVAIAAGPLGCFVVWRRMAYTLDGQRGICCAVFRREAGALASDLIREADALADDRWPGVHHYTYVAPSRVRSTNPGYCFLRAGWRRCGLTEGGHGRDQLIILERC